jgi:hypothetical protein
MGSFVLVYKTIQKAKSLNHPNIWFILAPQWFRTKYIDMCNIHVYYLSSYTFLLSIQADNYKGCMLEFQKLNYLSFRHWLCNYMMRFALLVLATNRCYKGIGLMINSTKSFYLNIPWGREDCSRSNTVRSMKMYHLR